MLKIKYLIIASEVRRQGALWDVIGVGDTVNVTELAGNLRLGFLTCVEGGEEGQELGMLLSIVSPSGVVVLETEFPKIVVAGVAGKAKVGVNVVLPISESGQFSIIIAAGVVSETDYFFVNVIGS